MIYGAPRSNIIARTVYLRRYLITGCNSDLFCGRGRLDMSSRISDHYLRLRSISLIAGQFLLWVVCVHSFLRPQHHLAMILSSGADISIIIAFFGGMPYSPPILHCRAVELQPLRSPSHDPFCWMPRMISGANNCSTLSLYVKDRLARSRWGGLAPNISIVA